jgi:hypothetical protein
MCLYSIVTRQPNSLDPCAENSLNVTILVVAIICSFVFGLFVSTALFFIMKMARNKRGKYFKLFSFLYNRCTITDDNICYVFKIYRYIKFANHIHSHSFLLKFKILS